MSHCNRRRIIFYAAVTIILSSLFTTCQCFILPPTSSRIKQIGQSQHQVRTTKIRNLQSTASRIQRHEKVKNKGAKTFNNAQSLEREIVHLGRTGRGNKALELYYACWNSTLPSPSKSIKPNTRIMNAAIDACARSRPPRTEEAFQIFENAVDVNGLLTPNVFTFGALMSVCARGRNVDRALSLLKNMEEKYHVEPNAIVYSTAISAAERASPPRPEIAIKLLDEATSKLSISTKDRKTATALTIGYNTAISCLAKAGMYQKAIRLLDVEMPEKGIKPDEVTYGTVMAACERSEEWQQVLKLADRMEEQNLEMDGIAITTVLKACQKLSWANGALRYIQKFKDLESKSSEFSTNGKNNYMKRKTKGKQRSGTRAPLTGPDDVAYCLAISACSRVGRVKDAIMLLRDMGDKKTVNAYTCVMQGCYLESNHKTASDLLKEMKENGIQPNVVTYSTVISTCGSAIAQAMMEPDSPDPQNNKLVQKLFSTSWDLLDEMKSRGIEPNIYTYNALLKVCAESYEVDRAFDLLDEIVHEKNLNATIVTFGTMMMACERVGDIEAASKVFSKMKQFGVEPNEYVYGAAISCCRKSYDPERAFLLLRKMMSIGGDLYPNTATFNTVLLALTNKRQNRQPSMSSDYSLNYENLERALKIYKKMKSPPKLESSDSALSNFSERSGPNRRTYSILIEATAAEQFGESAEEILKDMEEAGFTPDVELYTSIVRAYEQSGKPLKALRLMEKMREAGIDFYEIKVLDDIFKKAVKLANTVTTKKSS